MSPESERLPVKGAPRASSYDEDIVNHLDHAVNAEEAAAFDRVLAAFPESTVGETVPHDPEHLRAIDDPALDEPDGFELVPLDFARLLAEGIPEPEYLSFPYLPRGARVWAFGPAESAKTIYFQWLAAKLTREGKSVVFVSQENPLQTDVDRIGRLHPDPEHLRYYHMANLDLADPEHFTELALRCHGADLVVIDTLSACWSGDENDNAEIGALDRDRLVQLVRLTGVTPVVIHHTGHPQAWVNRSGAGAGRGASAMGQKADVVLVFQSHDIREFTIEHGKNRSPGGYKEEKSRFRIVDTEDGNLDIERIGKDTDPRVAECIEEAMEFMPKTDGISTNALKAALKARGFGGSTIDAALAELKKEDPPRVRQVDGWVIGADGKRRKGRPWVLADAQLPTEPNRTATEPGVQ